MRPLVLLPVALVLFAAGEVTNGSFSSVSNLTALGAVIATLWWLLTRTIPGQQKVFQETLDKMAQRWDEREQKRDAENKAMTEALQTMQAVCAQAQQAMRDNRTL